MNILLKRDKTFFRYVTSWLETREHAAEKTNLIILFDKYIPLCLENVRKRFKKITPVADISHIQTLCYLLDCLLNQKNLSTDCSKELYEMYFSFACIWAFGSPMFQDQVLRIRSDHPKRFEWPSRQFSNVNCGHYS